MRTCKTVRLLCLLLLISMGVAGCATPSEPPAGSEGFTDQGTSPVTDEALDLSQALRLVANGETGFLIIYPAANANMEKDLADRIRAGLIAATGVRFPCVADDSIAAKKSDGEEILIGLTNREESQTVHGELRSRDYSVSVRESKVVLAGLTYYMLSEACEAFVGGLVSREDATYSTCQYTYVANYTAQDPCVNGVPLKSFRIVHEDRSDASELARAVRAMLETDTGYLLPVVTDAAAPTDHEILIGNTNRAESAVFYGSEQNTDAYRISCENGKPVLAWGSACVLGQVNKAFYSGLLKLVYGKTVDLGRIEANEVGSSYNGNELSIMTYNVLNVYRKANQAANRADLTASILYSYRPDVIGLQEYDDIYRQQPNEVIGQMAPFYTEAVPAGVEKAHNWNPILYRSDRLELLECGHEAYAVGTEYSIENGRRSHFRSFTWAVFRVKETGKTVTVFNTHLDTERSNQPAECAQLWERVKQIHAVHGGTLLLVGDYNCPIPGPGVDALTGYGFRNTYDIALSRTDTALGHQAPVWNISLGGYVPDAQGTVVLNYVNSVDHCMYYGIAPEVLRFESSTLTDMLSVSDHSPVYVRMKLN